MASTFTDLGIELMATGENAGTWGTKTNANLSLVNPTSSVGAIAPTSMTIGLTGQSMTSTVGTGFILKYFGKITPKDSTGYTTKTPKNTTGYTTKVAN